MADRRRGNMNAEQETRICKLIEDAVESSVTQFFKNKEVKVTHVLDLIFPTERRIRSLIGGLETSMGTRVWEPLAKKFAEENGFIVHDEKKFNKSVPIIPDKLRHMISDFETKKKKDNSLRIKVFVDEARALINNYDLTANVVMQAMPKGEGVDVWLSKNEVHYLIDIKTNQINAGGGPKFLTNQLNWVCYQILQDANSHVNPILAFPFNPHETNFWVKEKGKVSPLIPGVEARVGDEFWDFLLGRRGTTKIIFKAFENLGKKDFGKRFSYVFEPPKSEINVDKL
ncbi:TdeIII family type II restriction endonuclease [Vreelandella venusta]|uniref:type II site-specific deoxyribonuclease n=2 Tax=Vreelandella venusta TaxID=44935 RepID=A0ABX2BGX0_9GAMM|nr:TdeIII family type II restriction endonuclease [Halomonas venusta]NPT32339.1 hypothetical protein [Halomonas venusta]